MKIKLLCFLSLLFSTIIAQAAPHKITVMLDWYLNPDHAPLFIAQQLGYFAQQNLSVDLVSPADPSEGVKLVAAGKADIAIDYQPALLIQVSQGLPLMRFGTLVNQPLNCLIALKDSPYKTLADLKNQTIGYSDPGVDQASLDAMLQSAKLNLNDVSMMDVNYGLVQSLVTHRVAATIGMMRNYELLQLMLMGKPGRAFYPEEYGVPNYDELIFVTNKKNINNPDLRKFLVAEQQGLTYLISHPVESWLMLIKAHPEMDNKLNEYSWFETIHYFTNDPGYLNAEKYNQFMQFMVAKHLISKPIPLEDYAVNLLLSG